MTREQAKELLPIIQAFAEGKAVEYLNDEKGWIECSNPSFWEDPKHYRIKPEPKYRPCKNVEECCGEMLKHHPVGWVKTKTPPLKYAAYEICEYTDWNYRFYTYTFADGTPFGIKEE